MSKQTNHDKSSTSMKSGCREYFDIHVHGCLNAYGQLYVPYLIYIIYYTCIVIICVYWFTVLNFVQTSIKAKLTQDFERSADLIHLMLCVSNIRHKAYTKNRTIVWLHVGAKEKCVSLFERSLNISVYVIKRKIRCISHNILQRSSYAVAIATTSFLEQQNQIEKNIN
ncbi:hypothetical protein ACF0H5_003547 [Mactra antiquata]